MSEPIQIVRMLQTAVWVEDDIFGARHVVCQHEGMEAFTYCTLHYGYGYTDNAGTLAAADEMAVSLGATQPVEHRPRELPKEWAEAESLRAAPQEPQDMDAARYRWLREHSVNQWEHPIVVSQKRIPEPDRMQYYGPLIGKALDKAIDAARGKAS